MNKFERLEEITKLINKKGSVTTNEIVADLNVSDMTVRRDLSELEEQGVLTKIYGGARSNDLTQYRERSHKEKHTEHVTEKRTIAHQAAAIIEEGDNIFLGPGTTIEILAEEIDHQKLTVITNCLPVFEILNKKKSLDFKVFLLGGTMRDITQSFVGEMTNTILSNLKFNKMFFSSNAVNNGYAMTSSVEEAYTQQLTLNHSLETYLLVDSSKVFKEDFNQFCDITEVTGIYTDALCKDAIDYLMDYNKKVYY